MIYTATIQQPDDSDEFRCVARGLLSSAIAPRDIAWTTEATATLFTTPARPYPSPDTKKSILVPRSFAALADTVICHRNDCRWPLLYEALWRISHGERWLMEQMSDPLIHRLHQMAAAVRRDQHRMTAFVRFRALPAANRDLANGELANGDLANSKNPDLEHYVAWYEPQHRVLRPASSFFVDRFASMRFSILTPDLTLHWDRTTVRFASGLRREDAVSADAVEDWWRRYYASIFNPARLNASLMRSHMPSRFWRNLPEAAAIFDLIANAGSRTDQMIQSLEPGSRDQATLASG